MALPVRSLNKLACIIFVLHACSTRPTESPLPVFNSTEVSLQMSNGLAMKDGNPFTGIVYQLQPVSKDTIEIVGFKNGREHGQWKKFYEGGNLQSTRQFTNGKKTGDYLAWWPNGTKQLSYHFEEGEYEGLCQEWNAEGVLVKESNYEKGYESGPQKQFYDNGKLRSNYVMVDGKRYGLLGTKNCVNVTDSIFKK